MYTIVPQLFARALALADPPTSAAHDPPLGAPTAVEPSESYEALIAEAEAQRNTGDHARAATLYTRAYRARPAADRADDLGLFIIKNAIADYRLALAGTPSTPELLEEHRVLLEQQAALLDDVIRARRLGDLPPFLVDAELDVEQRLAALADVQAPTDASPDPRADPPRATTPPQSSLAAQDHLAAARVYEAAYEAMDGATQDGSSGTYNVLRAVSSYCSAHAYDHDETHLLAAKSLITRFADQRHARGVAIPSTIDAARQRVNEALLEKTQCDLIHSRYTHSPKPPGPRACSSSSQCRAGEVCDRRGSCKPKGTTIEPERTKRSGIITAAVGGVGLMTGGILVGVGAGTFSFGTIAAGAIFGVVSIPVTICGVIVAAVGVSRTKQRQRYYEIRSLPPSSRSSDIPTRTLGLAWRF